MNETTFQFDIGQKQYKTKSSVLTDKYICWHRCLTPNWQYRIAHS